MVKTQPSPMKEHSQRKSQPCGHESLHSIQLNKREKNKVVGGVTHKNPALAAIVQKHNSGEEGERHEQSACVSDGSVTGPSGRTG